MRPPASGVRLDDLAEGERGIVEGVDELAHIFHALADGGGAVLGEARGGEIARDEAFVDGFGDEVAALEREHDAAAENRVEEGQGRRPRGRGQARRSSGNGGCIRW